MRISILWIIIELILFCRCSSDEISNSYELINVPVNSAEQYVPSKWFNKIEIVPLETNERSLFANADKLFVYEDRYFILDRQKSNIIVFDKNGNFLYNSTSSQGNGPGEYVGIIDFEINRLTNELVILEPLGRLVFYNEDFEFIGYYNLPKNLLPLKCFRIVSDDCYVFYAGVNSYSGYSLLFFSLDEDQIIGKALKILIRA